MRQIDGLRRSRLAWRAAAAPGSLVLAGLIGLALSGIGFAEIGRSLSHVHPWWLVAALALNGLSMFLRAVSWRAVLHAALPDVRLRSLVVVRATMIGVLVSALIPGRLGEPARAYLIARRAGDTGRRFPLVLGTVFAQTLINLVALAILAAITIASLALIRGHATTLIAAMSLPIAAVLIVLADPALLARARRSHDPHLSRIVRRLSDQIIQVRRGLRVFTRPLLGAGATVSQLAAWAVQTLAAYAVLNALNLQGKAGLAAAAAILLAVNFTALVPVTPSNIGIFQAGTIAVLAAYSVDASHALSYGILLQAIEITTAIVLGVPPCSASESPSATSAATPQPQQCPHPQASEGPELPPRRWATAPRRSHTLAPPPRSARAIMPSYFILFSPVYSNPGAWRHHSGLGTSRRGLDLRRGSGRQDRRAAGERARPPRPRVPAGLASRTASDQQSVIVHGSSPPAAR